VRGLKSGLKSGFKQKKAGVRLMYTALYRQWRPDTFEGVVGQDTIVQTLKNQLFSGRIAHAYLFCGSRGTGKTSTAKIFSRAINCTAPTEDGPCGQCEACINLSSENNMDIIEIDAASNNGVDEIRDLRDKVRFPPTVGKYKVYIIDEVHMLSIGAFNALLKTLEEPPAHVVFILATTEPHKLPATILSRCQRFDFKRIPQSVIVSRMKTICSRMNVKVEEAGLYTIARWAEGGMRDALSLLDQCMGFCGTDISNEEVLNVLGTADESFIFQAAEDIQSGNAEGLLRSIDWLINDGKDLNVFLRELIQHLRNLLIVKFCDEPERFLDMEGASLDRLKSQAEKAGQARLIRSIDLLTSLESEMKWSTQPRVLFELAAVKLCRPQQEDSMEALLDRIETLEKQLKEGVPARTGPAPAQTSGDTFAQKEQYAPSVQSIEKPAAVSAVQPDDPFAAYSDRSLEDLISSMPVPDEEAAAADYGAVLQADYDRMEAVDRKPIITGSTERTEKRSPKPADKTDKNAELPKAKIETEPDSIASDGDRDPVLTWPQILEAIGPRSAISSFLVGVKPRLEAGNILTLIFPDDIGFGADLIKQDSNKAYIEEQVLKVTGRKVRVRCLMAEEAEQQAVISDKGFSVKKVVEAFGEDLVKIVDEE
jgi:DNA polymerase-3 subunit gamma/tau